MQILRCRIGLYPSRIHFQKRNFLVWFAKFLRSFFPSENDWKVHSFHNLIRTMDDFQVPMMDYKDDNSSSNHAYVFHIDGVPVSSSDDANGFYDSILVCTIIVVILICLCYLAWSGAFIYFKYFYYINLSVFAKDPISIVAMLVLVASLVLLQYRPTRQRA